MPAIELRKAAGPIVHDLPGACATLPLPDMIDAIGAAGRRVNTGQYHLLHKYLRDRFADRVVLRLGEIEDLLGFPLPAEARLDRTWWDGGTADRTAQSDAWTFAHRTATVNLRAGSVVFERQAASR